MCPLALTITAWRRLALDIVTGRRPSTTSQRHVAWLFLRQHGVA